MLNNFYSIPKEIQEWNSWICWRYEDIGSSKPTKIPYCANTGMLASVNDPSTWSDFNTAVEACSKHGFSGIGFVFSDDDPFFGIDLDHVNDAPDIWERQQRIYKEFNSYSEVSPSGYGLHIIGKGKVPAGRRRSYIEVYSSLRYLTFTGNVYGNNTTIEYRQDLLSQLWEQMGSGGVASYIYKGDDKEIITDDELIVRAKTALNGDKFIQLHTGQWQGDYPSQSEADLAYINMLAFYTQNKNQITRLFHQSPLGQRTKAKRTDYLNWMINKSFDRLLPKLDLDGFKNAIELNIAENKIKKSKPKINGSHINSHPIIPSTRGAMEMPPGMLGEITRFIYEAAPRPVPEIALAGAIGLMAGICGRAYNISNTGLNQYILVLAKTGAGKEASAAGIDKLMHAIKLQCPTANDFIGPSHIASGQALVKYVHKKSKCFVSMIGEFGHTIKNMSSATASNHERMLKQVLLELYNKSGHDDIYRASINADLEKNTEHTESPAFSLLCESVPSAFYEALDEEMIREGLLPRFMIMEYNGPRVDLNQYHADVSPSPQLIQNFAQLISNCHLCQKDNRAIVVKMESDALQAADELDKRATAIINSSDDEITLNLWNRAHLKSLKLAALVAVGNNMLFPTITLDNLKWAMRLVEDDIQALSAKFERGDTGNRSSENKQQDQLIIRIKEYIDRDWENVKTYCNNQLLHSNKIVPYGYLSKRLLTNIAFKTDRMGATNALQRTIKSMLESDKLRELSKIDLMSRFGTTQRAFVVSDMKILSEHH